MSITHVVINGKGSPGRFECLHCGAVYTPGLPCPIQMYIDIMESFGKAHDECLLRKEGRMGPAPMPDHVDVMPADHNADIFDECATEGCESYRTAGTAFCDGCYEAEG